MKKRSLLRLLGLAMVAGLIVVGCGKKEEAAAGDPPTAASANPDQGKPLDMGAGKDKDGPIDPKSNVIEPGREPVSTAGG